MRKIRNTSAVVNERFLLSIVRHDGRDELYASDERDECQDKARRMRDVQYSYCYDSLYGLQVEL